MKKKCKELLLTISVVYTLISVGGAIVNMIAGTQTSNTNVVVMFILVCIACTVLSMYRFWEKLSPLLIIILQYVITIALVMGVVYITSFFDPVAPGGYWDIFRSFTIPYVILAAFFYIDVFRTTKKENDILKEIQQAELEDAK